MKKVLVDINIILDFLNQREDHASAAAIFNLCTKKIIKGYMCSHEITTLSYFLEKHKYPRNKRIFIITKLLDTFSIISSKEKILRNALNSDISDYEDAVIEESARSENIDLIITRNLKDFRNSKCNISNAAEALFLLQNKGKDV